jgi:DNA recombination protein RmuC
MVEVLMVVVGIIAGLAVGWLAAKNRTSAETTKLHAELAAERATLESYRANEQRLEQAIKTLSRDAIRENNQTFAQLVAPLREDLAKVEHHVSQVERTRVDAYSGLREQVDLMHRTNIQLRTETAQLVAALRAPQVRGRWGEHQLRRIVEAAGMVEQVDFSEQVTMNTLDGGVQRPDMVVKLADGKHLIVDAKAPISAYLEAMEARDEIARNERLQAHAKHLRSHVETLSCKEYWAAFDGTPEFVVLFVPADTFLDAALRNDAELLEHAFARNIVIATPSTLVALLRTIAYTWRQEALAKNAEEIHQLGKDLYQRLATFGDHFAKIGSSLNSAVNKYNQAVGSLEGRVLVSARKFAELQGITKDLPDSPQLETVARQLQAPELVES